MAPLIAKAGSHCSTVSVLVANHPRMDAALHR